MLETHLIQSTQNFSSVFIADVDFSHIPNSNEDLAAIERLFAEEGDVHTQCNRNSETPLHYTASFGDRS